MCRSSAGHSSGERLGGAGRDGGHTGDAAKAPRSAQRWVQGRHCAVPRLVPKTGGCVLCNTAPANCVSRPSPSELAKGDGLRERLHVPGLPGLFFYGREHKPINRNYFNSYVWHAALRTAGVPLGRENGMHVLRHSAASTWLEHGVSIKAVSELLGSR